jgi:DNA-3-methyladenine glycosylase II
MKLTPARIQAARRHLRAADPVMKAIIGAVGPYTLRFETLTQVKGIGRWTAQMFLIFSLGRPDVFPHDDLGVRTFIRERYGLDDLPDKETSHRIAAPWRPYCSVASWYCWRSLDLARNTETVAKGYPS